MEIALSTFSPPPKVLRYGTAGFRDKYELLHSTFLRMGVMATIKSQSNKKCIGIMITASHNPEVDNGIKIVDADGGMLNQRWEPIAEAIANEKSVSILMNYIEQLRLSENNDTYSSFSSLIVIGRDTRPHSLELSNCVKTGIEAAGGRILDLGEVTTPQVHFIVHDINSNNLDFSVLTSEFCLSRYSNQIIGGYLDLIKTASSSSMPRMLSSSPDPMDCVVVDASNGVGSLLLSSLIPLLPEGLLSFQIRNPAYAGPVNEGCGAELVQKERKLPRNIPLPSPSPSDRSDHNRLLVSFDGDADRIVLYSLQDSQFSLLDGDKIAALLSLFLIREFKEAGLALAHQSNETPDHPPSPPPDHPPSPPPDHLRPSTFDFPISFGCVQTAYANGSSSAYLSSQQVPIALAKTGVKYLHHRAQEFDVGIYYEANGHGTVLFSARMSGLIGSWGIETNYSAMMEESRVDLAKRRIFAFSRAINQTDGDAVSNLFVCLACLQILNLSIEEWIHLYSDLPSKQIKISLSGEKKQLITCTEDETRTLTPPSLQVSLDEAMKSTPSGRCFVRPSGTEDAVRVYAEAETQDQADRLAEQAAQCIELALS